MDDQLALARTRLWTPDLDRLLRRWKEQIGKRQEGHARQARKLSRRHYIIGIPTTLLSVVVTTGVLSTFRNCSDCEDLDSARCEADQWIRLVMGLLGFLAVALSALMTFMNYQELSEQHKNASSDFENLHRVIETLLQVPASVRGDPVSTLHNLRDQYTALVRGAPQLPKEYAVYLTYKFKGPTPPSPTQIQIPSDTSPLRKLLDDESSGARDKIKRWTKRSSLEDGEEIEIGFDLDSTPAPKNKAALKAALLTAEREGQVQKSLSRAIEFELQRLDTHVESEDSTDDELSNSDSS